MNNGKSNTKGSDMRRLVALVLLVAFCVAFLSPPASATQWDPRYGPFPEQIQTVNTPSGDDNGWVDPHRSPADVWYFLRYSYYSPTLFWLYDILPDVDRGDDGVTNPFDQSNDPDANPNRTTSSD